jgi:hypothetical protein
MKPMNVAVSQAKAATRYTVYGVFRERRGGGFYV